MTISRRQAAAERWSLAETPLTDAERLAACAVVFEEADPPRAGCLAFWNADGSPPPAGAGRPGDLSVAVPTRGGVRVRVVPAVRIPVADAMPLLARARLGAPAGRSGSVHPAAAFWGAVAIEALHLVAGGRVVPAVSAAGFDAWRAVPPEAYARPAVRELAAAMPVMARAVPVQPASGPEPGADAVILADGTELIRGFLDAVADVMLRTPAAATAVGGSAFAALEPQPVSGLRAWAEEIAAGTAVGGRVRLRLEHDAPEEGTAASVARGKELLRAVVQVHSRTDVSLVADAGYLWSNRTGAELPGFDARDRIDIVVALRRAARVWPPLGRLLEHAVPDEIALVDEEIWELRSSAGARLAAAGIEVRWPAELAGNLAVQAVVGAPGGPPPDVRAALAGDDRLSFSWQLVLDGEPLTDAEADVVAAARRPVARLRDRWVLVDPDLTRKARARRLKPVTALDGLGYALSGTAVIRDERTEVVACGWLDRVLERIADPDGGPEPVRQPGGLNGVLRDYQLRGLRWLERMTALGLGGCLADEMGLGKTVMLIALHLRRHAAPPGPSASAPTLVVCPASLLGNWEREIGRFAPGVRVRRFHGQDRTLDGIKADDFVLTTYGMTRLDADRLRTVAWGLVVADEAQHVKNPASRTAKALRRIPADSRVALTGTPVENNLSELWAILDWTTPGLLGSLRRFRGQWARPVELGQDAEMAERLSRLVRPLLLRRRKSDPGIAPELPRKTETDHPAALTGEQVALYEAVVRETMAQIRTSDGIRRRGLILKLLTELKQVCNHPAQYLKERGPELGGRSGKLELLDELLDTILSGGGAALVFTQYVAMGRLIEGHLEARGVATRFLHGSMPVPRREQFVQEFQDGQASVFLLSLKAGGTGLNLTRADHVLHYDRWWNPAVEDQASDRAHRIGQTRPVQIHRLIAEGTVEDHIAAMMRSKHQLAEAILSAGDAALTELSDAELADLVELRPEQAGGPRLGDSR